MDSHCEESHSQKNSQPTGNPHRVPDSPSRLPIYRGNGVLPHHSPMHRGYSERLSTYIPQVTPTSIRQRHEAHHCVFQIQELGPGNSSPPTSASPSRRTSHHDIFCPRRSDFMFEKYRPLCEIQKSLKKGEVIEGILRINPKNFEDAYISAPDEGRDIYIQGAIRRNRALNGDQVVVEIDHPSSWKELREVNGSCDKLNSNQHVVQRTGKVVAIMKELNTRKTVGKIVFQEDNTQFAKFHPRDRRMPRILIPCQSCPSEVATNCLYLATIESWPESSQMPYGKLQGAVGIEGSVEAETWSIILENGIETIEFPPSMHGMNFDSKLIEEEALVRMDLRDECVFTIDPSRAKDLDDAISIRQIGNELYQVGVHIADVSFYVHEGSDIDEWAQRRGSTFYLENRVIPMLPPSLSEKACSLNPGHDKLTVSVIWNITGDGLLLSSKICRSVISSCIKLNYDQAQSMIDDTWENQELPIIFGKWNHAQVANDIRKLSCITEKIRLKRRENGSLVIQKTSLSFDLHGLDQTPVKMYTHSSSNSKRLVEELMLLANMAIAKKIATDHPSLALLRNHPPPDSNRIDQSIAVIKSIVPSASVENMNSYSLQKVIHDLKSVDKNLSRAFAHLLLRSMKNASYFCTGSTNDPKDYLHFALNVDRYTHFTSPIRRYADVIVHRLLMASLGHSLTRMTIDKVTQLAEHCTERNITCRIVSEQSQKFFFSLFIRHNSTVLEVIVVNILDRSFDAVLPFLGITCRVYLEKVQCKFEYRKELSHRVLNITWPSQRKQSITTGISVRILVQTNYQDIYKFEGILQED